MNPRVKNVSPNKDYSLTIEFTNNEIPPAIQIPETCGINQIQVQCFSDLE